MSPDDALRRLLDGNDRFARGMAEQRTPDAAARARLLDVQQPFATVLGCSDARVPPEMVFDQGLGDLFVVRVAGNVVAPEVLGSLGYALVHLQTPLFVVLGHERCGAVQAALRALRGEGTEPGTLGLLLADILPALAGVDLQDAADVQVRHAVVSNVRGAVRQLAATPAGGEAIAAERIRIVGAVYDLGTGRVRVVDEAPPCR